MNGLPEYTGPESSTQNTQESHGSQQDFSQSQGTPNNQGSQRQPQQQQSAHERLEEILDLDGKSKFRFGGKEWTPDALKKSILMHGDYTKKTQELSKERTYIENLAYDLVNVRKNPGLREQFLKTYPEKYHAFLESMDSLYSPSKSNDGSEYYMPPEIKEWMERVDGYITTRETDAYDQALDAKFKTLSSKYPDADEDVVLARAEAMVAQKIQLTDETWDRLFKASHDRFNERAQAREKTKVEQARTAHGKAKDIGPGGGIAGQAPRRQSMKDATEAAIRDLSGG